jgi:hypothetical protein
MSEQENAVSKERTVQDIQVDYQNFILKAGQFQYQISCLEKDLELCNSKLRDLNLEHMALQNKLAEAAKVSAAETKAV